MKKTADETEDVPLREERSDSRWEKLEEGIKDEILYRKVIKPTGVPHAYDILKGM
jgi:hypothetical protein